MKDDRLQTDTIEKQKIVRNYYEKLYDKKFENLCEMDTFLEKYKFPKTQCRRSRKVKQTNNSRQI